MLAFLEGGRLKVKEFVMQNRKILAEIGILEPESDWPSGLGSVKAS